MFSGLVWTDGYSSSLDVMIIFLALDALNELFTRRRAKTFVRNVLTIFELLLRRLVGFSVFHL